MTGEAWAAHVSFGRPHASLMCVVFCLFCFCFCFVFVLFCLLYFVFASQAYNQAQAAGKELEVVYVPVADSAEVRSKRQGCFLE